jgi:hypothetical protein
MRPTRAVLSALSAWALALCVAQAATAQPTVDLIWRATNGDGIPGGPTISAEPGDVLTLDIRVSSGGVPIQFASLSLQWDAAALSPLFAEECPSPPNLVAGICREQFFEPMSSPFFPGVTLTPGLASSFDVFAPVPSVLPSNVTFGSIDFVVQSDAAYETVDVHYVPGYDSILDDFGQQYFPAATADTVIARPELTSSPNIGLAANQIESGIDTSENPDVTGGLGGSILPYTATGSFTCCGPNYLADNLHDGDVGAGNPSDGLYAIPDSGSLVLDLGTPKTVASIAVYSGYTNRDDGSYALRDDQASLLGSWTLQSLPDVNTNDGTASYWLVFDTPVTTSSLTLEMTSWDAQSTLSFREIQVLPEPGSWLCLASGAAFLTAMKRGRARRCNSHEPA